VRFLRSCGFNKCMTTKSDIEQLFRSNYRAMLTLATCLLHDADTARDIVHDVFESVLSENLSTVTSAYLLKGVRFACLKQLRSLSLRERFSNLYALDFDEIEDEQWPDPEDVARLNELIDEALSMQDRRVVKMRFVQRMTYIEIAGQLGISEVAVYKHLRHAMNVLRQKF
ncbi:MAG: RNA polymerase sigma factor, partial [Muribaculaceae bacterium]